MIDWEDVPPAERDEDFINLETAEKHNEAVKSTVLGEPDCESCQ